MLLSILPFHITWVIFQQFIRRDLKPAAFIVRIQSTSSIFKSPQKGRHFIFFKEILAQMFVWNSFMAWLMTPLLILTISSKNLKWIVHTVTFWSYLLLNMAVWWSSLSRSGLGRGKGHWWATTVWYVAVYTTWRNLQCLGVVI